jgi:uncharacterized protein YegP (UPF0339 family)
MARKYKVAFFQDALRDQKAPQPARWRWHVKAGNGLIVADSGEGYNSKANAVRAYHVLAQALVDGRVEE